MLASFPQKKDWYLYRSTEMLNKYDDNFQISFTLIKNSLFILQTLYILLVATVTYTSIFFFIKFWYKRRS